MHCSSSILPTSLTTPSSDLSSCEILSRCWTLHGWRWNGKWLICFHFNLPCHAAIETRAHHHMHIRLVHLCSIFLCLCIQIHNMYYNTQDFFIWQNPTRFIAKPLLLTILLTSQAIELESTSKNVSFNASTYIVPFRLHGGIPLSSSLVSNSIFWRWMATMKDEICLLLYIYYIYLVDVFVPNLKRFREREQFHSKIGFVPFWANFNAEIGVITFFTITWENVILDQIMIT